MAHEILAGWYDLEAWRQEGTGVWRWTIGAGYGISVVLWSWGRTEAQAQFAEMQQRGYDFCRITPCP